MYRYSFFLLLFCAFKVWAQPANDNPCTAIALTGNTTCTFTFFDNNGSTTPAGIPNPSCGGTNPGVEDVWFTVTVPPSGNLIIDTEAGTLNNIAMAVYSAPSCAGPFTQVLCDASASGANMPQVTLTGQTPGTVLYVRIWDEFSPGFFGIGVDPRQQGTFQICFIAPPQPPFNDNPCQAITLVPGQSCVFTNGTNVNALTGSGVPVPSCGGNSPGAEDVWYVLQVPSSGSVIVDTDDGSLNNMAMAAYSASSCNGPFTQIACDADASANGNMPRLNLTGLTPGSYVFIRIWDEFNPGILGIGVDPRQQGTFSICAQIAQPAAGSGSSNTGSYSCGTTPAAGNTCATATPICTFNGYCGSTQGYTADYWFSGSQGLGGPLNANGIFCGSIENNSFITFFASSSAVTLDVIVSGSVINCDEGVQFMMFGDPTGAPACGSLSIVDYGCESPMPPGNNTFTASGLTPGQQYYLMIDGFAGDLCNYQINAVSGVQVGVSIGPDRTVCLGQSTQLTVFGAGSGTITWTGPNLSSGSGQTVTVTPTATGSYQYIVTAPNISGACGGPTSNDTVNITVVTPPIVNINVGPCNNGATQLTATGATNYTWIPPADINNTSGSVVTVSPSVPTTYTVNGTNNGGCIVSASVTVGPGSSATIDSVSFCVAQAPTNLTVSGTQGGNWSGPGITNASLGTFNPSLAGVGTHRIIYETTGSCAARDSAFITVTSGSSVNTVAAQFCISSGIQNLTASGTGGGTWSGPGIVNSSSGTFNPVQAGVGTHIVSYAVTGACPATDTALITVVAIDSANISSVSPVCAGAAPFNLSQTGTAGGSWSGNGISNVVSGTFNPTLAGVGSHLITYTTSGFCPTSDTLSISVISVAFANINPQAAVCQNIAAFNLTVSGTQGGSWTGNGISDPLSGLFNPALSGIGNITVIYSISGSCAVSDTAVITVIANDQVNIVPASFCLAAAATNLTVNGTSGGNWSGNGITNGSNGTFDPSVAGVGIHQVVYISSGPCPDSDTIDIIVSLNAFAEIDEDTFCNNIPTVNLTVNGTGGGSWSGNSVNSNGTFSPQLLGSGSFTVIYNIGGSCPASDTAVFLVIPIDSADIQEQIFCVLDNPTALSVTGTQGGTWSGTGISDSVGGIFDPSIAGVGVFQIIYTTNGICPVSDTALITVTATGTADIEADSSCVYDIPFGLNVSGNSGGIWTGTGIIDTVNGIFNPALVGPGNHWVYYSTQGNCAVTDSALIYVDIAILPNAVILPANVTDSTVNWGDEISLSGGNDQSSQGVLYSWTYQGPGAVIISNPNAHDITVITDEDGLFTFYLSAVSSFGCTASDTVTLNVEAIISDPKIPTAFSPNNDQINDLFEVVDLDKQWIKSFKIYNRWGQLVYDNAEEAAWNGSFKGEEQPRDVYMYVIEWQFLNAETPTVKRGNVSLLK
jgi:gliding motility-associated-like protein